MTIEVKDIAKRAQLPTDDVLGIGADDVCNRIPIIPPLPSRLPTAVEANRGNFVRQKAASEDYESVVLPVAPQNAVSSGAVWVSATADLAIGGNNITGVFNLKPNENYYAILREGTDADNIRIDLAQVAPAAQNTRHYADGRLIKQEASGRGNAIGFNLVAAAGANNYTMVGQDGGANAAHVFIREVIRVGGYKGDKGDTGLGLPIVTAADVGDYATVNAAGVWVKSDPPTTPRQSQRLLAPLLGVLSAGTATIAGWGAFPNRLVIIRNSTDSNSERVSVVLPEGDGIYYVNGFTNIEANKFVFSSIGDVVTVTVSDSSSDNIFQLWA